MPESFLEELRSVVSIALIAQGAGEDAVRSSATIIASIVAAIAALIGAILAFWSASRVARLTARLQSEEKARDRKAEAQRIVSRVREPLVRAAYDLQSRLYNIARKNFLRRYLASGRPREAAYARKNTLFLVAQFFAWNEIIRREVQFLDLGNEEQTRTLANLDDSIVHTWLTDTYDAPLRVFAGDQRAIGERLVCTTARGLDCMGYAEFLDLLDMHPERIPQLAQLENDLDALAQTESQETERLVAIQCQLIDLIDFLDANHLRYPQDRRRRLVQRPA
jgi:hypothetical protein